jgi:KipI family sensor histidine kinase inhibitor
MSNVRVIPAGDGTWLIELEDRLDEKVNARAIAIGRVVRAAGFDGVRDIVTGYRSVAVYVDPGLADPLGMAERLTAMAQKTAVGQEASSRTIDVPVCYGGDEGPDLAEVAAFAACSEEEAVAIHCDRTYRVYLLGFAPGFPYLGIVDPRIAMPRRATPRVKVPAGSVGIAGRQTGIYPTETSGGWRIIGRTPIRPFDANRRPPCLFEIGEQVRFTPVSRDAIERWEG